MFRLVLWVSQLIWASVACYCGELVAQLEQEGHEWPH